MVEAGWDWADRKDMRHRLQAGNLETTDQVKSPLLTGESSGLPPAPSAPMRGVKATGGLGTLLYPQDPGKARWLAGSGALLSGLLLFLLLPPLLFSHMEGWSYMEGFYFAFITLSTVGFGDYVIGESSWRWAGRDIWLPTPLTHLLPQLAHLLCARHVGAFRPKIRRHCPTRLCCVTGLRSLRPFVTNAERSDRSAGPPVVLRRPHMTGVPASLPGPCLPQALPSPLHSLPREHQSVPLLLDWRPQYPRIRQ